VKTKGAVLWGLNEKWSVEEIELDPPQEGELLVEFEATGLCHSDHHIRTGDMYGVSFPLIGGHEGAGVVQEVGPGVRDVAVGDHVVTSFLPACGRCRWCATGRQNLCDYGAIILAGVQADGTFRLVSFSGRRGEPPRYVADERYTTVEEARHGAFLRHIRDLTEN